ncbi:hypothetical protein FJY63_00940 [Candidatus Sumerlaeota bacterium]|nr:hypothetical protein [Candidatus Sumerlaeota bacterium]
MSAYRVSIRLLPYAAMGLLSLLPGACATVPPAGSPSLPLRRPSVRFYVVHEQAAPNLTMHTVERTGEAVFLTEQPDMTEEDIERAQLQVDPITRRPAVTVYFSVPGAEKFAVLTSQNVARRLAITIEGRIISTPLITTPIRSGRARIEGFNSEAEARRIAYLLNLTRR